MKLICAAILLFAVSTSADDPDRDNDNGSRPPPVATTPWQSQAPAGAVIPPGFTMCFDPLGRRAGLKGPPSHVCAQCHEARVPRAGSNIHTRHLAPPRSIDCFYCHGGGDPVAFVPPPPPLPNPAAPPACTFTFSDWTRCQSNGTRSRTVRTQSPTVCTGHAHTLEFCGRASGRDYPICPVPVAPSPPPIGACTGFTYSAFVPAICPPVGQRTRTVLTALPTGCTGGTPIVTQACTPATPPPLACNAFTYSAFVPTVCPTNGIRTRTVVSASPAGCTGGSPVFSQSCTPATPPPPTLDGAALYTSSCQRCHGSLAGSEVRGSSASQISGAISSNRGGMGSLSGLTPAQIAAIASVL
jgi:cbb3-type cytochrome c oxidase subunit III